MLPSLHAFALALTLSIVAACSPAPSADTAQPDTATTQAITASLDAAQVLLRGTFSGQNDHVVTGGVQILKHDGKTFLRLDESFSLDGAPDPKIAFGHSGQCDESTTFTALTSISGKQDYALPDGFELGSLDEAYIWCDQFTVSLGVAKLQR